MAESEEAFGFFVQETLKALPQNGKHIDLVVVVVLYLDAYHQ